MIQKVYGEIITTSTIAEEFGNQLPDWVKIQNVSDLIKLKILEMQIDKVESSAIALALETQNSRLILDDYKARKVAENLSLNYTGTIGIIIKAKLDNIIPSIKPLIEKIKETNFRISPELE